MTASRPRLCVWCETPLVPRANEWPNQFKKRVLCNTSCTVAYVRFKRNGTMCDLPVEPLERWVHVLARKVDTGNGEGVRTLIPDESLRKAWYRAVKVRTISDATADRLVCLLGIGPLELLWPSYDTEVAA